MNYKGEIIEESLDNEEILKKVKFFQPELKK